MTTPTSNFELPTSNFELPTSNFQLPTSNFQPPTSRTVTNRDEWNSALVTLPTHHVLQSWEWGQFKGRWGWSPRYLLFEEGGMPRAAALILRREVPWLRLG